jgi:gliding motility-associated-like protein
MGLIQFIYMNYMESTIRKIGIVCTFLWLTLFTTVSNAQHVINNGDALVISSGAYVVVGGNFINKTAVTDGKVDLDGTILLNGDFENYSSNQVFVNQEAIPDGHVVLRNSFISQSIKGDQPTHFENIEMQGDYKLLESTNSGVSGALSLDAIFKLNSNNFVLYNSNPSAIHYVSNYILSETNSFDGYGTLDWRIGSQVNQYNIPFGSGNGNTPDLALTYFSENAGMPSTAGIKFATYPTNDMLNFPLPTGVSSLNPYDALKVADRYWITNAEDYTVKPLSSLIFTYRDEDIESGNAIVESKLKAIRSSNGDASWNGIQPAGVVNTYNNTMSVMNISQSDWRTNWALTSIEEDGEFWVPLAYTPNEDAKNEVFVPVFGYEPQKYTLIIYDRWGETLFTTNDYKQGWDGIYKSKFAKQDVYVWKIFLTKSDGLDYAYRGHFSLLLWE